MKAPTPRDDGRFLCALEDFLHAGTSAFLLSAAHVFPDAWPIATLALVPFLWCVIKVGFSRSVILSTMLGASYVLTMHYSTMVASPLSLIFKVIAASAVFAVFAVAVKYLRSRWDLYPVFIAILWLPLEYFVAGKTSLGGILSPAKGGAGILVRVASIFGILTVSFVIVLINMVAVVLLENAVGSSCSPRPPVAPARQSGYIPFNELIDIKVWWSHTPTRAPPDPKRLPA